MKNEWNVWIVALKPIDYKVKNITINDLYKILIKNFKNNNPAKSIKKYD